MPCPKTGWRRGAVCLFLVSRGEADEAVEVIGETGADDGFAEVGGDEGVDLDVWKRYGTEVSPSLELSWPARAYGQTSSMNAASESDPGPPFESLRFCRVELTTVDREMSFSSSSISRTELESVMAVMPVMMDAVSVPSVPSDGDENVDTDAAYGVFEKGVVVPVDMAGEANGLADVWVLLGDELAVDAVDDWFA